MKNIKLKTKTRRTGLFDRAKDFSKAMKKRAKDDATFGLASWTANFVGGDKDL